MRARLIDKKVVEVKRDRNVKRSKKATKGQGWYNVIEKKYTPSKWVSVDFKYTYNKKKDIVEQELIKTELTLQQYKGLVKQKITELDKIKTNKKDIDDAETYEEVEELSKGVYNGL